MSKREGQSIDLQVKLYEASTDYFMYLWYSDIISPNPSNIIGSFQLNTSRNSLQDGYTVKQDNTIFILLIKNLTLTIEDYVKNPFAGIQISLFDRLKFFGETQVSTSPPEVPWTVIIIAGSVGGLIIALCLCASGYILIKSCKRKKIVQDNGANDQDEDRLNSLVGLGQQQSDKVHNADMVATEFYDTYSGFTPKPNKHTVKVQPQRNKQNHADEVLAAYGGDIEMQELPHQQIRIASFRPDGQQSSRSVKQISNSQSHGILSAQQNEATFKDHSVIFQDPDASIMQLKQRSVGDDDSPQPRHQQYTLNTDACMIEHPNTDTKLNESEPNKKFKEEALKMHASAVGHEHFYNNDNEYEQEEEEQSEIEERQQAKVRNETEEDQF